MTRTPPEHDALRIGVSSCLLGETVRWDGSHRRDAYVVGVLSKFAELVPVCPEVAIGLGVPRHPIRLVSGPAHPRALLAPPATGSAQPLDVSDALYDYGRSMDTELSGLSGYIFKSKSPSCGLRSVPVFPEGQGQALQLGAGLTVRGLRSAQPALPLIDENGLKRPLSRGKFFTRVFAFHRWNQLLNMGLTAERLLQFHHAHRLLLLAHGFSERTKIVKRLSALLEAFGSGTDPQAANSYIHELLQALNRPAKREGHLFILDSLASQVREALDSSSRRRLSRALNRYARGEAFTEETRRGGATASEKARLSAIAILRDGLLRCGDSETADQCYLNPHPHEALLCGGH